MNQMGNLEKLGILVIVILVVVVGVVAITPKDTTEAVLFPDPVAGESPVAVDEAKPLEGVDGPVDGAAGGAVGELPPVGQPAFPVGPMKNADPAVGVGAGAPITPASQPAAQPVTPPAPVAAGTTEYTVVKGDSGESIAKKTLGRRTAWSEIVAVNPGLDARKLKIGQKIKIPAAAVAQTPAPVVTPAPVADRGAPAPAPIVGPAPAPAPAPAPTAERTYVVQPGDTLSDIARREMKSASRVGDLVKANQDVLRGSEVIRVGMKLRIPSGDVAVAPKAPTTDPVAPAPAPAATGAKSYKVQSGDSLSSIAARFLGSSSRWREILKANDGVLHGSDRLKVGMELSIPGGVEAR